MAHETERLQLACALIAAGYPLTQVLELSFRFAYDLGYMTTIGVAESYDELNKFLAEHRERIQRIAPAGACEVMGSEPQPDEVRRLETSPSESGRPN